MKRSLRFKRKNRGMSLVELTVSVTTFLIVGAFMTAITLAVGREARETIITVPAEQQAFRAMDFIRRELLPSVTGTVTIAQDGSWITFRNAGRSATSRIEFDSERQVCVFTPDIEVDDQRDWGRGIDGAFTVLDARSTRIRVEVNANARDYEGEAMTISYRDELTIRN